MMKLLKVARQFGYVIAIDPITPAQTNDCYIYDSPTTSGARGRCELPSKRELAKDKSAPDQSIRIHSNGLFPNTRRRLDPRRTRDTFPYRSGLFDSLYRSVKHESRLVLSSQ